MPSGGRRRAWRPERLARLLAVTVPFLVAANPYAYFYDGLLLLIPAIIWYVCAGDYVVRTCHRVAGLSLAAVFAWQHVSLFWLKDGTPLALTGVCVYVWFVAEVVDLLRSRREESVASSDAAAGRPVSGGA